MAEIRNFNGKDYECVGPGTVEVGDYIKVKDELIKIATKTFDTSPEGWRENYQFIGEEGRRFGTNEIDFYLRPVS
ncbi:MAG: hypothetical protein ABIH37_00465 [archaeon]